MGVGGKCSERGGEGDQEECGRDGCMEGRSERAHALLGRSLGSAAVLVCTPFRKRALPPLTSVTTLELH